MPRPFSPDHPQLFRVVICILLMISFSACSESTSQPSGDRISGTGGISFRLAWQRPSLSKAKSQFSPSFNACADYAIDTIAAAVYDAADSNRFVTSDSWPCSAHEGFIFGIPAGTNYTVTVEGRAFESTMWSGLVTGITVTDLVTDAGTISLNYIGGDATDPSVISIDPAADAVDVPVTARMIISFSEPLAISTVSATNIALVESGSGTVPGNVSYDAAGYTAAFTPAAALAYDTTYALHVLTGITDRAGRPLASASTNTFMTESAPSAAPAAPWGVAAVPGNGQVTLDWLAANGATSYNIYYGLSSGVTPSNITDARAPFIHIGLTNGQTYYYLVEAVNSYGTATAAEVNATPLADTLASGLVAYYPFNGNANDASGQGNDGIVSGATLTADRFEFGSAAYDFDGSTSDISLGDLGAIDDYSVSLWFKKRIASGYPSTGGQADLFGTQTSAEPWQYFKFGFDLSYQDAITVAIATTSSDYRVYTTPLITDTTLHHLVVTRTTVSVQVYLDDVQQSLTSAGSGAPAGAITSGNVTKVGTVGGVTDAKFDGSLDDVRIYSRLLSAAEVARLYYAGSPDAPSAPADLTAVPGNGQNVLTWSAVTGATSYNLYWSTTPIAPDKTAADFVIRNVTSPYAHTGLTNGQTLYYLVTAVNSHGESADSIQVAATPN